jgi:small subunit ribosomal protein S18
MERSMDRMGGGMGSRPRREGGGGRGGRDFRARRKVCVFCVDKVKEIDYKDTNRLRRFISDRGKIEPRRKTGTCAKHQRRLSVALKRARFMALLPYTGDHIRSIEAGGHGGHGERRDLGRPDRSSVETPGAVPGADGAVASAEAAPVEAAAVEDTAVAGSVAETTAAGAGAAAEVGEPAEAAEATATEA